MHGVSAEGKRLWSNSGLTNTIANTHAPITRSNEVFFANGYNTGHAMLRLTKSNDSWSVEEAYRFKQQPYVQWLGSPTSAGDSVFITTFKGLNCLDFKTGNIIWEQEKIGRCMFIVADGKMFIRTQGGKMLLVALDPKEWKLIAEFAPPRPDKGQPAWTFPVVANGRLYVRDYDTLLCYDVRDPDRPKKKVPDAVFVPTPHDVVVKMLEMAAVKKDDVVYDLGSGDGRIVIAAAKTHGCKAIGVEIDKELVDKSQQRAKELGVEKLVRFECGDLFETDFSNATVVALYILPEMSRKLIPKLDKLKPGSRVVSHAFAIPGGCSLSSVPNHAAFASMISCGMS
jgi:precorrin-6B methylase 2